MIVALLLVTATGIVAVAGACSGGSSHTLFGMSNCPETIVHHVAIFLSTFAAIVAFAQIFVFGLTPHTLLPAGDMLRSARNGPERPEQLTRERSGREAAASASRREAARGLLRRRDDPDSSN